MLVHQQCHHDFLPFMNREDIHAICLSLDIVKRKMAVLEWGSGNSTIFFSARIPGGSSWSSYEHDRKWHREVHRRLTERGRSSATVTLVEPNLPFSGPGDGDLTTFRDYVAAPTLEGVPFDYILVDGRARVACMSAGWSLLRENGLMVLHDAQRRYYDEGIPRDSYWIRTVNPEALVDGVPTATLFMAKKESVLASLERSFRSSLTPRVKILSNASSHISRAYHYFSAGDLPRTAEETLRELKLHPSSKEARKMARTLAILDATTEATNEFPPGGPATGTEPPPAAASFPHAMRPLAVRLYAGDIPSLPEYDGWIGLSLTLNDDRHIRHDITTPFPLPDNSVKAFQSEDVFEHIDYERLPAVVDEVFRILKPGALFRLSVPDYGCDVLRERAVKDKAGNPVFDPGGGGTPGNPGHLWFPRIDSVYRLLKRTRFYRAGEIHFLHYWNMDNVTYVTRPINYTSGVVRRTPDFDERVKTPYRPMSLVVDLVKR